MTDMIERVARALSPFSWSDDAPKTDHHDAMRAFSLEQARWAIEAMRAPTPEMIEAGNRAIREDTMFNDTWTTMIDQALSLPHGGDEGA